MVHEWMAAVANHLWQSTVFGLCAMVFSLGLRRAAGRVRFRLWLGASLKFLVPFALLESIGKGLAPAANVALADRPVNRLYPVDVLDKPFTFAPVFSGSETTLASVHPTAHLGDSLPVVLLIVWCAGALVCSVRWLMQWRRAGSFVSAAQPAAFENTIASAIRMMNRGPSSRQIDVLLSGHACEPGIFGIFRPRLLWPLGLSESLSENEIEAIVAHELCHVRRRDNLTMTLHMLAQTLFWFHPLVWWLRARLIDEREQACDEAVVEGGFASEVYATGILRACEFSLEGTSACVSGVSGSDLGARIRRIVHGKPVRRMTRAATVLLAGFLSTTVLTPVLLGRFNTPTVHAALMAEQSADPQYAFEVATIKPSSPNARGSSLLINETGFEAENIPLFNVVQFAYDVRSASQMAGAPDWVKNVNFDIQAKEDAATIEALRKLEPAQSQKQMRLMIQVLLADRCHLKVVRETGERPVYALVVVKKGGSIMKPSNVALLQGQGTQKAPEGIQQGIRMNGRGDLQGMFASTQILANVLARMPETEGRPVVDRTGLTGTYDFSLKWTPELPGTGGGAQGPPPDNSGPSLFTALQEQLGLKLEPQKGSVEILRIDSIERPSEN